MPSIQSFGLHAHMMSAEREGRDGKLLELVVGIMDLDQRSNSRRASSASSARSRK